MKNSNTGIEGRRRNNAENKSKHKDKSGMGKIKGMMHRWQKCDNDDLF